MWGGGGGEKKGKKAPFGKNSSNHNKATHRSLAVRHMRPLQKSAPLPSPPTHTACFVCVCVFFLSFIDLNSFSASNTRNRPTFSHPLLCGRLIFGLLRSIGDHFWENRPFSRLVAHPPDGPPAPTLTTRAGLIGEGSPFCWFEHKGVG